VADNLGVKSSILPLLFFDGPVTGDNCLITSSSFSDSSKFDVDKKIEYGSKLY
jgi:hypothetical protein